MALSRQKKIMALSKKRGAHVPNRNKWNFYVALRLLKICVRHRPVAQCVMTFIKRILGLPIKKKSKK